MRVLRQTLEGPAGSRPDSPDVETLAGAASGRAPWYAKVRRR
jgi:hypothetical protein